MSFTRRFSSEALSAIATLQVIFGWCVFAFFLCAGFLGAPSARSKSNLLPYTKKRAQRLLIPCFTFSLAYKLLLGLFGMATQGSTRIAIGHITFQEALAFLFIPASPQFYFLPFLFTIDIVAFILIVFAPRSTILSGGVLVSFLTFYWFTKIPLLPFGDNPNLLPAYFVAYWSGRILNAGMGRSSGWWCGLIFVTAALCVHHKSWFYFQLLIPIGLYLLVSSLPKWRRLESLGRESGSIFVWHDPLLLPALSIILAYLVPWELIRITSIFTLGIGLSIFLGRLTAKYRSLSVFRI